MKWFATFFISLGLAMFGPTALAENTKDELDRVQKAQAKPQPVQMTEAQLDGVAAGLVNVLLIDTVDVDHNNVAVEVAVPVAAAAAVAILGAAGAAQNVVQATRFGRQFQ